MPASLTQSWTFTRPSPLGDVSASYELTAQGLQFSTDTPLGKRRETLRWDAIVEAATAVVDLPAGKGGPDMAHWIPGHLEWLLVRSTGPNTRPFMGPLPSSDTRDAIVAGMRERLGRRWVGEGLPLQAAQKQFGISSRGDTLKVAGLVLSVLGVLLVMLVLVTLLSAVFLLPAGFLFGGWLVRRGLAGLSDATRIANTATANIGNAVLGPVKLEGRAVCDRPSEAGVSGRPSVWWDVTVDAWSDDRDDGGWNQVMARYGGHADLLMLEDASGRVPVWLRDADLLLKEHTWESGKHALPERGAALLQGTAFAWNNGARLRVRETRMEAGALVHLLGTLDEACHLPAAGDERGMAHLLRRLRTGAWRNELVLALPTLLHAPVAIAFSYVDMLFTGGRGGERSQRPGDAPPPHLASSERVVWKGRAGHALLVSDQREPEALAQLRTRSRWMMAIGVALLCWCAYELVNLF